MGNKNVQAISLLLAIATISSKAKDALANEEQAIVLPPVTTSMTRHEPWRSLDKNRYTSIQVNELELERSVQRNTAEHLRGRTGVELIPSNEGKGAAIHLRGTVATQNAVTFDGVPLLQSIPGDTWLDTLPGEAIGKLSVTQGSHHAYRTFQGTGGTIDISSISAHQNKVRMHVEGGSFATLRETISVGRTGRLGSIQLTGSRSNMFQGPYHAIPTDKSSERDPASNSMGIARYNLALGESSLLQSSVLYREGLWHIDTAGLNNNNQPVSIDSTHSFFSAKTWLGQKTLTTEITNRWLSKLQIGFTRNDVFFQITGSLPFVAKYNYASQMMFANWQHTNTLMRGQDKQIDLVWGVHGRIERGEKQRSIESPYFYSYKPYFSEQRNVIAGFGELQAHWERGYLGGGFRLENHSQYGLRPLLHIGGKLSLTNTLTLHSRVGNSFRLPDYGELYNGVAGNPALLPEEGINSDIGLDWKPNTRTQLKVTGFLNQYKNMVNMEIDPTQGHYHYVGIPNVRVLGMESTLNYRINSSWQQGIDYTYMDAKDLDQDQPVALRARNTLRYWLEWQGSTQFPMTLRATLQYRSGAWHSAEKKYYLDDTVRVNLWGSYQVHKYLSTYLRMENITNDRTQDTWQIYRSGITFYGGIHSDF